ncbi:uncharacterized protein LAESUDRAFT_725160 [Laetiporus sulphureus 93-53]|uniref:Secreted protein n=1 Tax=Laetiporus sulphureus 93-53 TaxID=1314785 RepID=A0A165EKK8_9APHY|nr:uncharacterized protein LAESUDRAFT_725160 [Laetiporus sulphureus 93-53]KZT07252.1 hypothetical protein LAESUDRAFT_725160 [Laetiporus sulphureus 93-53]
MRPWHAFRSFILLWTCPYHPAPGPSHETTTTRVLTAEDFFINVATKNLEDKVAAAGRTNSPRMARRVYL